jgi:hypothetical protein
MPLNKVISNFNVSNLSEMNRSKYNNIYKRRGRYDLNSVQVKE